MASNKFRSCFNSTPGSGDEIRSYLNAGGADLTSTLVGGKQALDVNLAGSDIQIDVDLDGVYDAVNNANPDNTGVIFHSRAASIGDVQQVERTTAAGPGVVLAADIPNVNAQDVNSFLLGFDGTDYRPLNVDTSGNLQVDIAGVSLNSKGAALQVIDTYATATASSGSASTTPATITALANQGRISIMNTGDEDILVNGSYPVSCGVELHLPICADVTVETASGTSSYEVIQLAV